MWLIRWDCWLAGVLACFRAIGAGTFGWRACWCAGKCLYRLVSWLVFFGARFSWARLGVFSVIGYSLARAFSGVGRLDVLCAGVVVGARFLGCWEFCGVGRFCDCLAGCAGRCKKRVFWLCQVVGRFPGRAGVWSSVPTYGCGRAIPARGVCFGSDWIVRSFCFDWRERFHVVVIGA